MDRDRTPAGEPGSRRFEPWPWALGLALAAMVAASIAFLAVATAHPDPVVRHHPAVDPPARAAR